MNKFLFILLASITSASITAGNIYKCKDENGKTVFSQTQCGDESKEISSQVKSSSIYQQTGLGVSVAPQEKDDSPDWYKESQKHRKKQARISQNITSLEYKRDKKIQALEKRMSKTTFKSEQERFRKEIQKVKQEYKRKIDSQYRQHSRNHDKYMSR